MRAAGLEPTRFVLPVSAASGAIAYVTHPDEGTVTPVDVATGRPGTPIKVGN